MLKDSASFCNQNYGLASLGLLLGAEGKKGTLLGNEGTLFSAFRELRTAKPKMQRLMASGHNRLSAENANNSL